MKLSVLLLLLALSAAAFVTAEDDFPEQMDMGDMGAPPPGFVPPPAPAPVDMAPTPYTTPEPQNALFAETFQSEWQTRWIASKHSKFAEGNWEVTSKSTELVGEKGLIVKGAAKHHAISALFEKPLDPSQTDIVVQYEVRFHQAHQCGGAYLKLLTKFKPAEFTNDTPYVIMFGPDKCGATDKVHFIFRHKNPITGEHEEKHLKFPPAARTDQKTHVYTLIMRRDNTFEVKIDQKSATKGSLLEDFTPAVNPPKEIDDPEDKMPADWVLEAKIPDPDDKKPDDWDDEAPPTIEDSDAVKPDSWDEDAPKQIADPEAVKPADWDDEADGVWEAPLIDNPACDAHGCGPWTRPRISNPAYKGKWHPKMIDNPAYKGEWKPRLIPNPNFFEDKEPHKLQPMYGLGIEIWTMQDDIEFDNFYVGSDADAASDFAEATWRVKSREEEKRAPVAPKPSTPLPEDATLLEKAQWYAEEYPAAAVVSGLVGAISLLYLLTRLFVKDAPQEAPAAVAAEPAHDHSHSHSHDGDHSHSHSHGPSDAEEEEEEEELKLEAKTEKKEEKPKAEKKEDKPKAEKEEKPKEAESGVKNRKTKSRKD